ncbi:magnesium transporter CorA family protein [Pseudoroseicyclus aestuarii]|uniref:Magnesium transporter n=1 Tax=Pseudoroseicyclus aestuarii TaxID=1795041 RepID=A0A318SZY8_9RHOB|nr:magnesium transporter CorA family protein [Pseudoroseicyclus aestuarii]PYE86006.1 magnesium transporter [Pseudoroseicyclus aestuarii]
MLFAYGRGAKGGEGEGGALVRLPPDADLTQAVWIDLYRPTAEQAEALQRIGLPVPSLAEMEEIEISNRLYREEGVDVMTVVLPGRVDPTLEVRDDASGDLGQHVAAPVSFLLTPERLVSVRHHAPRPFETFAEQAGRSSAGCGSTLRLFLGLVEEIVARQADLLEGAGRALDRVSATVFGSDDHPAPELKQALRDIGRQGELMGRVRLGLLTLERMLSVVQLWHGKGPDREVTPLIKSLMRDINALEVHADFLANRVSLATDATLGHINLDQNESIKALSVVAALFLPPTLIASIYGMNFKVMPELDLAWGYPVVLGAMVVSSAGTWAWFKSRGWL